MKKFLVLYKAPIASFDKMMKETSPEQAKSGMDAWMAWSQKAGTSIVDMGAPLGKAMKVTPKSAEQLRNDLGGFSIMQAESKEALADSLRSSNHPHFGMPDGFIEIVEMMSIPGM